MDGFACYSAVHRDAKDAYRQEDRRQKGTHMQAGSQAGRKGSEHAGKRQAGTQVDREREQMRVGNEQSCEKHKHEDKREHGTSRGDVALPPNACCTPQLLSLLNSVMKALGADTRSIYVILLS